MTAQARSVGFTTIALGLLAAMGSAAAVSLTARIDRIAGHGRTLGLLTPARPAVAARAAAPGAPVEAFRALAAQAPMDQGAMRAYGLALLTANRPDEGDAVMRMAGTLGWRDGPTQLYWSDVARLGDPTPAGRKVAVERLDAVMRLTRGRVPEVAQRMRDLEAGTDGIALLAERLPTAHVWAPNYLNDLGPVADEALGTRIALMTALRRAGYALQPGQTRLIETSLLGRMRPALAQSVAGRAVNDDPNFERAGSAETSDSSVFDWELPGNAGLEAVAERDARGPALSVRYTGIGSSVFASRVVILQPGSWRISMASTRPQGLRAAVTCQPGNQPLAMTGDGGGGFKLDVPANCPWQRLDLSIAAVGNTDEATVIRNVRIGRIR